MKCQFCLILICVTVLPVYGFAQVRDVTVTQTIYSTDTTAPSGTGNVAVGTQFTRGAAIENLTTNATQQSIIVTFTTERRTHAQLEWSDMFGVGGTLQSDGKKRQHRFVLDGLQPNMIYDVHISTFINQSIVADEKQLTVKTRPAPDITPPANVSNLTKEITKETVTLRWTNPPDADFDRVRIVRSTRGYPLDTVDGWVVYEQSGESFSDSRFDWPVYYTVFSVDASGNVSSGAIVMVAPQDARVPDESKLEQEIEHSIAIPPTFVATTSPTFNWPVFVVQEDQVTLLSTSTAVSLFPNQPFTLQIPKRVIPAHLKTIIAELSHPDPAQGSFSFLLRYNAATDAYEATIATLPVTGTYQLTVRWLDFATRETGVVYGALQLSAVIPSLTTSATAWWYWVLLGVVGLVLVRIIIRPLRTNSV